MTRPTRTWWTWSLWLYPPRFRARFASDYLLTIARLADEGRYQGVLGRLRLTAWLLRDAARSAPAEWRDRPAPVTTTTPPPRRRMDIVLQDLKYAIRNLRRAPSFVSVVVLSLGLGLGANALMFSVLDGVILRPFDLPQPERLVAMGAAFPTVAPGRRYIETLSSHEFLDIKASTPSLERHSAFDLGNRALSGGDVPERVFTALVWGDLLRTLGGAPALGRSFRDEETTMPGARVAMLSHRVWQSRFGGDSSLVGRSVRVNGDPHTIVGILPPEVLLMGTDLWVPMGVSPDVIPRQARQFAVLARVKEGRSLRDVNAELERVAASTATTWSAEHPAYDRWSLVAAPWHVALTSEDGIRETAFLLQAAVFLVLLIAWVNVAGLLVARATAREVELTTRRALGAGTGRLVGQLVTEGVILALAGAAVGLLLCGMLTAPLTDAMPAQIRSMGFEIVVNARVVWTTLIGSIAVGAAFGLVPLGGLRRSQANLASVVGHRASTSRRGTRLRSIFLGGQVALSVILLVTAGLVVRSMRHLARVDLGVEPDNVLTMRISVPREQYADSAIVPFIERLEERLRAVPGIRSVGAATQFGVPNFMSAPVARAGEAPGRVSRRADITNVTAPYLGALGYRLRAGRLIDERDTERSPAVAVINETAARRNFGEQSPIGQRLVLGDSLRTAEVEVVGVVGDARNRGLDSAVEPEVFVPARQQRVGWNNQFFLLMRGDRDPMPLVGSIRTAIRDVDAEQPVYAIATFSERLGAAIVQRRAAFVFLVAFASIALFLSAAGIYAMASHAVANRTREIGIRMALGAGVGRVRRLVLRDALHVVGVGAAIGVGGSLAASGAVRALVVGVSTTDPLVLVVTLALLLVTSVAALVVPLRAATSVAPARALRD